LSVLLSVGPDALDDLGQVQPARQAEVRLEAFDIHNGLRRIVRSDATGQREEGREEEE
jgi:hypothetical protein